MFGALGTLFGAAGPAAAQDLGISVASGDDQEARVLNQLDEPLVVQVYDAEGDPVPGQEVTFEITSAPSPHSDEVEPVEGELKVTMAQSNLQGKAETELTLGSASGSYEVVAHAGASQARFSVRARPGSPSHLTSEVRANRHYLLAGATQSTTVSAHLRDIYYNPLDSGGSHVSFEATAGVVSIVSDEGDGTYRATLVSSPEPDTALVRAWVNGEKIHDQVRIYMFVGPPDELRVEGDPANTEPGEVLEPPVHVQVLDAVGNRVQDFEGPLQVELEAADGASVHDGLEGTTERDAVEGAATFDDLRVTEPGTYRLRVEAPESEDPLDAVGTDTFVVAQAELEVDLEIARSEVALGDTTTVQGTVTNVGVTPAAEAVLPLDSPGTRMKIIDFEPSRGTLDPRDLRWTVPGLAPEETATFEAVVQILAPSENP